MIHHQRLVPLFILILALVACQDGPRPGSQPLPEPPAHYPDGSPHSSPSAGSSEAPPDKSAKAATKPDIVWEHLGKWNGTHSVQTESFTGLTGALRIKWEAKGPPDGTFLLTVHSSISGRPLQVAVDQKGPGADTAYVNEDPRVFFAVIETDRMEWSFSVDEAMGTRVVKEGK